MRLRLSHSHQSRGVGIALASLFLFSAGSAYSQIAIRGLRTDLSNTQDSFQSIDINGDGNADFLYTRAGGGYAGVYISHGDGTFRYVPYASNGTSQSGFMGDMESPNDHIVPLDINGDGKSDLLVYRPGGGYAFECLSNGDGTLQCFSLSTPSQQSRGFLDTMQNGAENIIAADLNGDGASDFILWTRNTGYARAYYSDRHGNFSGVNYAAGGSPANGFLDRMQNGDENFVAMDLNGDGKSDFLFSSPSHGIVRGYISDKNGYIASVTTYADGSGTHNGFSGNAGNGGGRALALDFNGDGKSDFLWYEPTHGFAAVYLSNGQSTNIALTPYLLRANGNGQNGFQGDLSSGSDTAIVLDFNGDGKSDLLFSRPGSGYATMYVSNGGSQNLTVYDYANSGQTSYGFSNDFTSTQDHALAVNFLGQKNSGFLVYRPGDGVAGVYAYSQAPSQPSGNLTSYSFHAYPSTFMSDLSWSIANTPMKGIVMPGTHDSAMYPYAGPGDSAITQQQDFKQQLADGARAFDFRFAYWFPGNLAYTATEVTNTSQNYCLNFNSITSADFWLFGHSTYCAELKVQDELANIRDYLNQNPHEIVIVNALSILKGVQGDFTSSMISELKNVFSDQSGVQPYVPQTVCGATTCNSIALQPQNKTPAQLWASNQRMIIMDSNNQLSATGYAWDYNASETYAGYCGGSGQGSTEDELSCLDVGTSDTPNSIQRIRPLFRAADAATTFLDTSTAMTQAGYTSLGNHYLNPLSPYENATCGLAGAFLPACPLGETNMNVYMQQQLSSGKWQANSLNIFRFDGISPTDQDGYVSTIIKQNDQSWVDAKFLNGTTAAGAISVGANGDVWAAPSAGSHGIAIYKYVPATTNWIAKIFSQPNVKRIAVDPSGGVYVVDGSQGISATSGMLLHFDANGVKDSGTVVSDLVQDVAVGAQGSVWAIKSDGTVFQVSGPTPYTVPSQSGVRISVSNTGAPWIVDNSGVVHSYNTITNSWEQMPALPNSVVSELTGSDNGKDTVINEIDYYSKANEISLGSDGSVFVSAKENGRSSYLSSVPFEPSAYSVWRYNPTDNSWSPFRMDATHIAVGAGGQPWAIRELTGKVYKGAVDQM